jgi:hypothetical protein
MHDWQDCLNRRLEMPAVVPGSLIGQAENQENKRESDIDKETHLGTVYSLSQSGETDRAIDRLFNDFEDLFEAGRFDICDEIISGVDLARLDTTLKIAYLAVTLCVKGRLVSRAAYYSRAKAVLVEREGEERAKRLLNGLE